MNSAVQDARTIAAWLEDGYDDRIVRAYDRAPSRFATDPWLLLQAGVALARSDDLRRAQRVFELALQHERATRAQREYARRQLAWIEREWRVIENARAALRRARLLAGGGLVLLAATAALCWTYARRRRLGPDGASRP